MKTEFLKNLGLDDEVIKQIQAESGKDVTSAKQSMQTQIDTLSNQLSDLQGQITQRDTDLAGLKTQLESAGQSASKLTSVQQSFDELQTKYNNEVKAYQEKLENQNYEFSIKEAINGVKFSSNSAKKQFTSDLLNNKLPMKDGKLLGFDDYLKSQMEEDPTAFVKDEPAPVVPEAPKPNFAPPAQPQGVTTPTSEFGFNFIGVRKHE